MKPVFLVVLAVSSFLSVCLFGQTLAKDELASSYSALSQAPEDRLVDAGGIFEADQEGRAALSQRLDSLEKQYGFSVYFIAYSGVIGSGVLEKAQQFRDAWLGSEQEGLILVCDTDLNAMAHSMTKVDGLSADGSGRIWKIPDHELEVVMKQVARTSPENLTEVEYLALIGHTLADELEKQLEPNQNQPRSFPLGFFIVFAMASGLILSLMWWAHKRGHSYSESPEKRFPVIEIPNRLGATFGGGSVSEISYLSSPDSEAP